jgi:hypothetical protein
LLAGAFGLTGGGGGGGGGGRGVVRFAQSHVIQANSDGDWLKNKWTIHFVGDW